MNHIYGYPHSKEAEFYKLLLDYDESLERDLADCKAIWYESGTQNLMVGDYGMSDRIATMVISKNFGFIKWLVDNDKIDYHKISDIMIYSQWRYTGINKTTAQRVDENMSDLLLMLLSIQDNPIEFLVSILK